MFFITEGERWTAHMRARWRQRAGPAASASERLPATKRLPFGECLALMASPAAPLDPCPFRGVTSLEGFAMGTPS